MIRYFAVPFFHLLSLVSLLSGVFSLGLAATITGRYFMDTASAVQITQVYSEGIYTALLGIGSLLITLVIQVMIYVSDPQPKAELTEVRTDVAEIRRVLGLTANMVRKHTQQKP